MARSGRPGGNPNRPPLPNGPGHGKTKGSKNKITRERWEQEVRAIAFYDPLQMFERVKKNSREWRLKNIDDMPAEIRRCLTSVKVRTENLTAGDDQQDTTVEVRLMDKLKALELGGRFHGWLKDKLEVTTSDESLALLDACKARARAARGNGE